MSTILFLDTVHPSLAERLTNDGYHCVDCMQKGLSEIRSLLPEAKGIVLRSRFTMNEDFLNGADQLRFIARSGVGLENIDEAYCEKRGIRVFNGAGANADAVGEQVIGMLLTLFNKIHTAHSEVRSAMWRREANRGIELGHRTVGIIGFGHTGQSLARKLCGFNCRILAYDKYRPVEMKGVEEVSLEEIKSAVDVLSFHVPLTEETHHYFDESFLSEMKNSFFLVNASRGKVASTMAMVKGLQTKKIRGLCLDVLEQEGSDFDLSHSDTGLQALISHDKALFSPHVAGWTIESYLNLADTLYNSIQEIGT